MKKPDPYIVSRVEARFSRFIINNAVCLEGCKCEVCFQAYLDAVVASSSSLTPALPQEPLQIEHFVG